MPGPEALEDGEAYLHRATRRYGINDDRQVGRPGDRREVPEEALLARLVVVRRDNEHRVGARLVRKPRELERLGRGVGARARNYGNAPPRELDRRPDHVHVLLVRQRGGFTGRADRDNPVDAAPNLMIDEPFQVRKGNALPPKGSGECGDRACEGAWLHGEGAQYRDKDALPREAGQATKSRAMLFCP